MPEQTVNDTVTNAVIAVLANDAALYAECVQIARLAGGQELEYETDREAGNDIRSAYGKEVCGELTGYVNWVLVGKHFRDEGKQRDE